VRRVVDRAAPMAGVEPGRLCMVVKDRPGGPVCRTPRGVVAAADLSRQIHIHYAERPFHPCFSCAPEMYDDLWTGGKCITRSSPWWRTVGRSSSMPRHHGDLVVHGRILHEIGYPHPRLLPEAVGAVQGLSWGIVAHSTHVRASVVRERLGAARVNVVLAPASPRLFAASQLGYLDPRKGPSRRLRRARGERRALRAPAGKCSTAGGRAAPWAAARLRAGAS